MAPSQARPGDAPLITIVDDDDAVRDSLRHLLIALGFAVEDFCCGATLFEQGPHDQSKCLILDVNLPGSSGLEILARLRAEVAELPVVMMSGGGDAGIKGRAFALGAIAFLDKPIAFEELRGALAAALASKAAAPSHGGSPAVRDFA